MMSKYLGICGVGGALSLGAIWSAQVYTLSLFSVIVLAFCPWVLAVLALRIASTPSADPNADLAALFLGGRIRTKHYASGETVIKQGELAEHFFIITAGKAQVVIEDEDYTQINVAELLPGQFFGEVGLINHGRRNASVEATEELDVLVLDRGSFIELIERSQPSSALIRDVAQQRKVAS